MDVLTLIKRHEGVFKVDGRHVAYRCPTGYLTVGHGRNLEQRGLSDGEAELLLRNDVREIVQELQEKPYWMKLSTVRRAVLINMAYNLGLSGLSKFKNMWAAVESEDFDRAADEMLDSLWAEQVKGRARELSAMMRTDQWPPPGRRADD